MAIENFKVGPSTGYDDNADLDTWPMNNFGDPRVNVVGGKYTEWTRRGYVYAANVTTAMVLPKYDATANFPAFWNPADSGKVVVPIALTIGYETAGTQVIHAIELIYKTGCGSGLGTPISAWTNVAPNPLLVGAGAASTKFSVVNTIVAGSRLMSLGMGLWVEGTNADDFIYTQKFDFDGILMLKPGVMIAMALDVASMSSTIVASLVFAELPLFTF